MASPKCPIPGRLRSILIPKSWEPFFRSRSLSASKVLKLWKWIGKAVKANLHWGEPGVARRNPLFYCVGNPAPCAVGVARRNPLFYCVGNPAPCAVRQLLDAPSRPPTQCRINNDSKCSNCYGPRAFGGPAVLRVKFVLYKYARRI